jgi:putative heme-binding domain-containing protein
VIAVQLSKFGLNAEAFLRWFRAAALASIMVAGVCAANAQEPAPASNPLAVLIQTLGKIENPGAQAGILRGLNASLKGKRDVLAPDGWAGLYEKLKGSPSEEVRQQAQALSATFGGGAALDEMRRTLADATAGVEARKAALDSLLVAKDAATLPLLLEFVKQPGPLRASALRGLVGYDDAQIPGKILGVYPTLDTAEKRDALNTLLARPASAHALLAAIDAKAVARSEITAPLARQLQNIKDPEIETWVKKNWGAVHTSTADKQKEIARYKQFCTTDLILQADASRGRAIFTQTCALCHTLFGFGAKIGPELPGSFEDVDYLLTNILDPNATIGKDYLQTFIKTKDGQMVSGIVASEDQSAVVLKTLGEPITVQRGDIVEMQVSEQSMMPEGLLTALDEQSVRDLFAYLRQRQQVPMLATSANAGDFFNGNDLTRWLPASGNWKVENGEIVGHSAGDKPAELLSEMIGADFRLTAQIRVSGETAAAELAFCGRRTGKNFAGSSLSFGGHAPVNLWQYDGAAKPVSMGSDVTVAPGAWVTCEIVAKGGAFKVTLDGKPAFQFQAPLATARHAFALYVLGKDAELRMKNAKIEIEAN